jgi:hypothetical protein
MKMAEVRTIRMIANSGKSIGPVRSLWNNVVFWTFLVGAEGISRMWFGGSWVIDVMIVTVVAVWATTTSVRSAQVEVNMTPAEIRRWVAAGMPLEIKEWRASEKARLAS